ncbi:type IV secretion system protein [Candidatus Fokinia crypta]|uniref:Type IV secretion system protein VirB6 n=1 Tax=Candidatus Fokinia crypta TaxID=1920990 RepID=A0ABZ0UNK0_9RICK|nr:type IV secretion system protein [Candidatus Fokinia cryptica]WPX97706.1 Type IV secretion system protein VirB6 [Candidatus Fokinia cryptica]
MNRLLSYLQKLILIFLLASSFSVVEVPKAEATIRYSGVIQFMNQPLISDSSFYHFIMSLIGVIHSCLLEKPLYLTKQEVLKNTCIPYAIMENQNYCQNSKSLLSAKSMMTSSLLIPLIIGALMTIAIPGIGELALLGVGGLVLEICNICANYYVNIPSDLANFAVGAKCRRDSSTKKYSFFSTSGDALFSAFDVPFLYQCKCGLHLLSMIRSKTLTQNEASTMYGCMDGMPQCMNPVLRRLPEKITALLQPVMLVSGGTANFALPQIIVVRNVNIPIWDLKARKKRNTNIPCPSPEQSQEGDKTIILTYDQINNAYKTQDKVSAYFSMAHGRVTLRAVKMAGYGLPPIIIGETTVSPPIEAPNISESLETFLKDTICMTFLTGRLDLNSLGVGMQESGNSTNSANSVAMFLSSDFHILSTVVGCIQTILVKIFVNPTNPKESFLAIVQEQFTNAFLVVMVLYIIFVGFNLLVHPEHLTKGQAFGYLARLVVAWYFGVGSVWFYMPYNSITDADGRQGVGLYEVILNVMNGIANMFMQSVELTDPMQWCTRTLDNGRNLLGPNRIDIKSDVTGINGDTIVTPSSGQVLYPTPVPYPGNGQYVYLSVWDFIDCSLAILMSFGSCQYSLLQMLVFIFVSAGLLAGINGFILSIVTLMYLVFLLQVTFKFTHMFILSMLTITILILLMPIWCAFYLFEPTRDIGQHATKLIIGYTLYPGVLFALIALFMTCMNSIFYGVSPSQIKAQMQTATTANGSELLLDVDSLCTGITSVFCAMHKVSQSDNAQNADSVVKSDSGAINILQNCATPPSRAVAPFVTTAQIFVFTFTLMKREAVGQLLTPMFNMMLMAMLFYYFSDSMITFVEGLTGVASLRDVAVGDIKAQQTIGAFKSMGKPVGNTESKAASAFFKSLFK